MSLVRESLTADPVRVFQVATGNVGTEMIKRISRRPDLQLVGVHCYSPEKVGRDVGEITSADLPLRAFAGQFAAP